MLTRAEALPVNTKKETAFCRNIRERRDEERAVLRCGRSWVMQKLHTSSGRAMFPNV